MVHAGRRGTALNLTCNAQPADLPTTQSRSQVGESCAGQPATVHSSSNPESEESADDRAVPRLWEKLLERPRAGLLQKTLPRQNSSRIPNCISRARAAEVILPKAGDVTFTTAAGWL